MPEKWDIKIENMIKYVYELDTLVELRQFIPLLIAIDRTLKHVTILR